MNFARNIFHRGRFTKKCQLKKKKKELFISAIKLFTNLLYKGSFYMIPNRKGREAKHKSQMCKYLNSSMPQTHPSACLETGNTRVSSKMLQLYPCFLQATSANLSTFTWASLSLSNRSPNKQKYNKKPFCAGTHPPPF